jgi:hypothetical protein
MATLLREDGKLRPLPVQKSIKVKGKRKSFRGKGIGKMADLKMDEKTKKNKNDAS